MSRDDHGGATPEGLARDSPTPKYLPRKLGGPFCGMEVAPNHRVKAIGTDEDVGVVEDYYRRFLVAEHRCYLVLFLLKCSKSQAAADIVFPDPLATDSQ
jgi:hypothetical protein